MNNRADSWGGALRRRRQVLGLRQDELAVLAGVSTRSVHAVESSKPTVRLDVLTAIVAVLGVDLVLDGPGSRIAVTS